MTASELIKSRYSCRAFNDQPVPKEEIEKILTIARSAPSGANTQPWEVAVVMGETKNRIVKALVQAVQMGKKPGQEFSYYPEKWEEPFKTRRFECGLALYTALDIKRDDDLRRKEQWLANYKLFGAPVVLFFFISKTLAGGALIDTGIFLQSLMLAAEEHGLATCAQASLGYYPDVVKSELNISEDKTLLFGLSIGYPDKNNKVNKYRTTRVNVNDFTKWFE